MRVPEVVLKCVGFVGRILHRDSAGADGELCATGFFVNIPCESPELIGHTQAYFVTAKHVADELADEEVYVLVNGKRGGVTSMEAYGGGWWFHPTDKASDVALFPVRRNPEADVYCVNATDLGTPQRLAEMKIGVGDEVFATGLFTPAAGTARNEPIVRHGNIAMLPKEQIQTELGYADVYLIEARSIGGLSGSPVFVRPTLNLPIPPQPSGVKNLFAVGHGCTLLGLMHGHWDIRESEMNKAFFTHDSKRGVNLGIGIVVPAIKIYETLYQPELVAMRKRDEESWVKRNVPKMDSAKSNANDERDYPFTREDFGSALKKASRKIEPSASDKPKK